MNCEKCEHEANCYAELPCIKSKQGQPAECKALSACLQRIVDAGCAAASETDGDIDCFFCGAWIGLNMEHQSDCVFIRAKTLLEKVKMR